MSCTLEVDWSRAEDPRGNPTLEYRFQRENGRFVSGCLWLPMKSIQQSTLMSFGHGASGDRYQIPIPYLAHKLSEKGIASLSMDGPVHGLRQKGEGGRKELSKEMRRSDLIEDMVLDWRASVQATETKMGFLCEKFGYFGLSMGSIFGIPYLAQRIRDNDPVTVCTLGLLGTTGAVSVLSQRLKQDASLLDAPTLFLMQLEDELFPRDGYLELFDALGSNDKRIHANPGPHPAVPAEEIEFCHDFVLDHLINEQ